MTKPRATAYRAAGVDLAAADETLGRVGEAVRATYTEDVLAGLGAFGGLFDASLLKGMAAPVLVASTDGVGTKTTVAAALGRYSTVGEDLVNHCVNDILVGGAKPLFFLDYVASSRLEPAVTGDLIAGVARGCRAHGVPLLGGETAELPGVYTAGEFDLAGTIVGVVDRANVVTGERIRAGDIVLGLPSGGLQTNGFSLARRALPDFAEPLGEGTVGDALLRPHRSFLEAMTPPLDAGVVRGMAHITGGGLPGNLPRVLPEGLGAEVTPDWDVPEIFGLIRQRGEVSRAEMYSVFNMGVGFVFVVAPEEVEQAAALVPDAFEVGRIVTGEGVRLL